MLQHLSVCPETGLKVKGPATRRGPISQEDLILVGETLFLLSDVETKIADHLIANFHCEFIGRNMGCTQSSDSSRRA